MYELTDLTLYIICISECSASQSWRCTWAQDHRSLLLGTTYFCVSVVVIIPVPISVPVPVPVPVPVAVAVVVVVVVVVAVAVVVVSSLREGESRSPSSPEHILALKADQDSKRILMSFAFEAFSTDLFSKAILLQFIFICFCWENQRNVFISLHFLIFLFLHHFNKHHTSSHRAQCSGSVALDCRLWAGRSTFWVMTEAKVVES